MPNKISLDDFECLCVALFHQRKKVDEMSALLKIETDAMEDLKAKIMAFMEESGKDKYPVKDMGLLYMVDRFTVPTPKSLDDKKMFFAYLQSRGIFFELASVNSATLNSFFKMEMEAAVVRGDVDFKLPGIGEPSHVRTLNIRKG